MGTQISLKLSDKMITKAKEHVEENGYDSLQEFIREVLRQKLFESNKSDGIQTYLASEKSLARNWLTKEEDKAGAHLQKEK